ncbi:MAG: histidine phosphatase family protein [Candidatus Saccharimonadales bacterium]
MEIILVRHGLSESNKAHMIGAPDTSLAPEGYQQAEDMAKRLADLKIDAIYSSAMPRAVDTAKPLARQMNTKVIEDQRIGEVSFGSWEGKSNEELVKATGVSSWELLDSYAYDFSPWGGEKYDQVETRVKSFLNDLKKKPYKLVLIVCHGGIVRCLHYLITGEKITSQPNAEEIHLNT